jgi:hypothetical protein
LCNRLNIHCGIKLYLFEKYIGELHHDPEKVLLRFFLSRYEEINGKIGIRPEGVTNLVEHPTQMRPPSKS